jgi:hypothetical protein
MRDSKAGLQIHQNASLTSHPEPRQSPYEVGLGKFDANDSGPHTEAEYAERVAASRRLGLVFGLVIVAIFWIVQWVVGS